MTAVDTSVVVPALLSWHVDHERCRSAMVGAAIPAHALVESYSVMTRLPSPHRIEGHVAEELLSAWFEPPRIVLAPARLQREIVRRAATGGIEGGAVYDALVGLTAREHGQTLLTRDRRAVRTYEILAVDYELLADPDGD